MKKLIFPFAVILLISSLTYSQNINGRISSSLYSFERFDTADVSNTHLRAFQTLNLNINEGKFSLRSYLNFETDLSEDLTDDPRLRFYNLYVEGRDLFDLLSFRLGRQPIFNSVAGGIFDGINIDLKKYDFKLTGYYGGNVPAYQKLEVTDNFSDNYMLGGKLSTAAITNTNLAVGYVRKNFLQQGYWASRLNDDLNPIQYYIENNSNQYEFLTGEASYEMEELFSIDTKYEYDLNFESTSRFEIFGEYNQIENLNFNLYYNYREPKIRYNSIFSVFDYGNSKEIEAGVDYTFIKNYTAIGKFGNVSYKDDESQRFTLGVNTPYGSVNYRKTLGYAGELDALSLYSAYTFLEGLLTPSLGVSYTTYKLSADDAKNNLTTLLAGVNIRPLRILSFDLQGQFMNNKIYKNDFRFFFKANYWFNTNL